MKKMSTALCLREIEDLFRPYADRKLSLVSRFVMAPLSRHLAPEGVPTPEMSIYYRRRAERGVGLIITESAAIDDASAADDSCMPRFYGGDALRQWKRICRAVHVTDCKIMPLLCHVGMARPVVGDVPNPEALPVGPSGIDVYSLEKLGEPMSLQRMSEVCASFARAALAAQALGFDGVEIHGGHGYLIDQFLWKETNRRNDVYGGDVVGRTRFACEVVHAVRKAVGRRFPIMFRFSQWKEGHPGACLVNSAHELSEMLQPLCDAGVDIFDCAETHYAQPAFAGSPLTLSAWTRLLTGKPVISGGSVGMPSAYSSPSGNSERVLLNLVRKLRSGELDLVAVGRALLADAEWVEKIHYAREEEIIPYSRRAASRLF